MEGTHLAAEDQHSTAGILLFHHRRPLGLPPYTSGEMGDLSTNRPVTAGNRSPFSRGLRRRYRLAEEETDEEIAGLDFGSEDLIALPAETWSAIRECAEELLTAVEVDRLLGAQVWLTKRGFAWISVPTVSGLHSRSLPVAATRFR
jgi:hypothetical protein